MNKNHSTADRLNAISEQVLCIGCGLCQSIAEPDVLKVRKSANGYERPIITGKLDHATVDKIHGTCSGTRVEGLPERLIEADTKMDNVWGPWRRAVRAWAAEPEIRFEGSTGGVLMTLGIYLLESGRVDFALHAKADGTSDRKAEFSPVSMELSQEFALKTAPN